MRLGFHHLEVLVTVADAGSIRKAAQVLQVAQPAVTTQLHRIETTLGVRLFDRNRDGVTPTELGRYAVTRARELLAGIEELATTLSSLAREELPNLALRVGGVAGPFVLDLVNVLHELIPGRETATVMEPMVGTLLDQVASGDLDLVVVHEFPGFEVRAPEHVDLVTIIAAEPVFAMVADSHPAAVKPAIGLADLAGDDWVMMTPDDTGLYARLRIICEAAGFTPRFRHAANDSSAAVAIVADAQAVSGMYATGRQLPGIMVRPLAGTPHTRRIMLAWRQDSEIADLGGDIVQRLMERYFQLADDRPHYAAWLAEHGREAILKPPPGPR
ncbi:LysR family transcriptional regulator [Longispora fulva]|uniref:DNA-binding transcriptional LysR family regulator n=1 Tax=Longispora fulva TaxID=619741 RepID=A0A8J7G9Q8_9ACTN|nr:LysR family transcriptional regulator [Longispora fulva]MBG6134289.1 DNA-binding transcriptional LysR family regulator [Longispora fulva]GIG63003.1 LysR family transcriptional regulator [Longispora fulva]